MAFEAAATAFDGLDALDIGDLLCEDDEPQLLGNEVLGCLETHDAFIKAAGAGFPFSSHGNQSPNSTTHHEDDRQCDDYDKRMTQRHSSSSSGLSICPDIEANNKHDVLTGSGLLEPSCSELRKIGSQHNNIDCSAGILNMQRRRMPGSPVPAAAGMPQTSQHSRGGLARAPSNAARMSRRSSFGPPLCAAGPGTDGSDDEGGEVGGAGKPQSHSSVEKQRRDRLNHLIEALSHIVPASDAKYRSEGTGNRRPKHVVLSDAISLLRELQEGGCTRGANPATCGTSGVKRLAGALAPLPMPMPINLPARALAGVMVEVGDASPNLWHITITCRDRPGLLADVAAVLRTLPLRITTASVTTSAQGKAACVFEVVVEDVELGPEEVQCAVNAALYAHLLPTPDQLGCAEGAKRARHV